MKRFTIIIGLFLCFLFPVHVYAAGLIFYVATNGTDTNPGTKSEPFGSILHARDHIRGLITDGLQQDVTVLIRGGHYFITDPVHFTLKDTVSDPHTITYLSYPGEDPIISGGKIIPDWNTQGQIWEADLSETGLNGIGFRELFINGQRRTRARAPNDGFFRVKAPGADRRTSFEYYETDLLAYPDLAGAEVIFFHDWDISRIMISEMKTSESKLFFANPIGASFSHVKEISHFEAQPRYYIENHPALLDRPGEWYFDPHTSILRYWTLPEDTTGDFQAIVPYSSALLELSGDPDSSQFVANLAFIGLTFSHSAWNLPESGYAGYQAGSFEIRPMKEGLDVYRDRISAAVTMRWANNCTISSCRFINLGGGAISIERGSQNITLDGNHIQDVGGNGIMVGEMKGVPFAERTVSGEWNLWWNEELSYLVSGVDVSNNTIQRCGAIFYGGVGVWIGIAEKVRVVRNVIHDLPYSGISIGWVWDNSSTPCNDNLIEGNIISDVMNVLSDGAGIYTLGRQDRTVIRNNMIFSVAESNGRAGNNGFFLDQGTKGILFENNIVFSVLGNACVRFNNRHAQNENTFRANIFVPLVGFDAYGPAPPETVFIENIIQDPATWIAPDPEDLHMGLEPAVFSAQGITEEWMNVYAEVFNQNSGTEFDHDSSVLLSAFITGTSPEEAQYAMKLKSLFLSEARGFSFPTLLSTGVGYRQLNRYYRIESASRLDDADWSAVPGFDKIPATGNDFVFPFPEEPEKVFYRMAVWLEEK